MECRPEPHRKVVYMLGPRLVSPVVIMWYTHILVIILSPHKIILLQAAGWKHTGNCLNLKPCQTPTAIVVASHLAAATHLMQTTQLSMLTTMPQRSSFSTFHHIQLPSGHPFTCLVATSTADSQVWSHYQAQPQPQPCLFKAASALGGAAVTT